MKHIFLIIASFLLLMNSARGEVDPIMRLKDDTLAYFKPVEGVVLDQQDSLVTLSIGQNDSARKGMRLKVYREGSPFIHPVTKELLGKMETAVGLVEITGVDSDTSRGLIADGEAAQGDKVRISRTKIKLLFCQGKNVDWHLADYFYTLVKDSGRVEMIDTALETEDEGELLAEAKRLGAEAALLLLTKRDEKGTRVREKVYWASDGSKFIDQEARVDVSYSNELKIGEEFFTPGLGEPVLKFDLPYGATFFATGNVDGEGDEEFILGTDKDIRIYEPGPDLKFLWEIKGSGRDTILWLDTIDMNGNGRSEIAVTALRGKEVVSSLYEFNGSGFTLLWESHNFLRKLGNGLIAQAYADGEGYTGDLLSVVWDNGYKTGDKVKVPRGVHIYDFAYVKGPANEQLLFAYDDQGYLNLYDERGIRLWRSSSDTGGMRTSFKKRSAFVFLNAGEWSVKDRLTVKQRDVLVAERIPLVRMAGGMGYKSSRIRNYRWNGFSMEEGVLIDDIGGTILDYGQTGDKIIVLASPFLGLKMGNILKGENPLGVMMYIYSMKGR